MAGSIVRHFAGLADPRSEQGGRHLLTDMLGITICAVIPLFICAAVWLGYTVRLTLVSKFQLRHENIKRVAAAHRDGAIGLVLLAVLLAPHVGSLVIGWSCVAAVAAYRAAEEYCEYRARGEPTFLRPMF